MLTLDKISTSSIFYSQNNPEIINLFRKYNIRNFMDLKQQIENGNPDFNDTNIINALKYAELQVRLYRRRNVAVPTYNFTTYDNSNVVDVNKLYKTDKLVTGQSLITTNIMHYNPKNIQKFNDTSISLIKEYAKYVTIAGTSLLHRITSDEQKDNFASLAHAIDLYDEQVIRSANDSKTINKNIFKNDYSIKKAIVDKHARTILKHLLTNGDEFIFGKLNFINKHHLLHSLDIDYEDINTIRKDRLLEMVADYTTLNELTSSGVLDTLEKRFILK